MRLQHSVHMPQNGIITRPAVGMGTSISGHSMRQIPQAILNPQSANAQENANHRLQQPQWMWMHPQLMRHPQHTNRSQAEHGHPHPELTIRHGAVAPPRLHIPRLSIISTLHLHHRAPRGHRPQHCPHHRPHRLHMSRICQRKRYQQKLRLQQPETRRRNGPPVPPEDPKHPTVELFHGPLREEKQGRGPILHPSRRHPHRSTPSLHDRPRLVAVPAPRRLTHP